MCSELDNSLIILAGIPGCGKSTFAKTLFQGIRVVSSDAIRAKMFGSDLRVAHEPEVRAENNRLVFSTYHGSLGLALDYGHSVVADATNLDVKARATLRSIAEVRGVDTRLVLFKNLTEAIERNDARDDFDRVPEDVMERMVGKYWDTLSRIDHEGYTGILKIESVT